MFEDPRVDIIISKLTRLTVKGELRWSRTQPPFTISGGTNSKFPYYAEASYEHNIIGYIEERYRIYQDADNYDWGSVRRLVMFDLHHNIIYNFPPSSALSDLALAIQEEVADIANVFNKLLS
jgi:hypothetical protein